MYHLQKVKYNQLQHACRTFVVAYNYRHLQKVTNDNSPLVPVANLELQRKFIPITRRTLIRKVLEQHYLVPPVDAKTYEQLIESLQKALSQSFHGVLSDLKHLYDPLNPDKETMIAQHFGSKERLDNEYNLLNKLSEQLHLANFQELSRDHISTALAEHPVYEGVCVRVDMKSYDVLRFWVLSEEEQPLYSRNYIHQFQNYINVYFKKWPKKIKTYKRVVVAVRTKKQTKLMLKAFKDIPQNGLEYFLPEGKITMSKYDKGLIGTTVTIGTLSALIKLLSIFSTYHVSWTYAVGGITGLLALMSWNSYKNKRNKYLVNLSKSLYFKNIANNRALLTLLVDRAEDELFKSSLLAYTFTRSENILKGIDKNDVSKWITIDELKISVDGWLKNRYSLDVDFDPQPALKQLEELGLLTVRRLGENMHLSVPTIEEALDILPHVTEDDILLHKTQHEEDLDIEELFPENDFELMDLKEKEKQCKEENISFGWNSK